MNLTEQNNQLKLTSKLLFGDDVLLKIVDPAKLVLLKENARFFKKETFKQLVANIEKDQRLSSVPLCRKIAGGKLEVLSGNHRVKASVEAKIKRILVMIILVEMEEADRVAIQLSHNALVGFDDPHVLAELWAKIDDMQARLYAGLDSSILNELEKVEQVTFTTPSVYTKSLVFTFTDSELENIDAVLAELEVLAGRKYLAQIESFEAFFEALQKVKASEDIKNGSMAMLRLI